MYTACSSCTGRGGAPLARNAGLLLVLWLLAAATAAAEEKYYVWIRGTRCADAYVDQYVPSQKFGSATYLRVSNGYGGNGKYAWDKRTLVSFDLADIPTGARIVKAELCLYYYAYWDNNPVGRILTCYRNTASWTESAVTWNTRPAHATTATSTASVPAAYGWMTWDVTRDVTNFHGYAWANYGWTIQDDAYWGKPGIPVPHFYAHELNSGLTPYLKVTYSWGYGPDGDDEFEADEATELGEEREFPLEDKLEVDEPGIEAEELT